MLPGSVFQKWDWLGPACLSHFCLLSHLPAKLFRQTIVANLGQLTLQRLHE